MRNQLASSDRTLKNPLTLGFSRAIETDIMFVGLCEVRETPNHRMGVTDGTNLVNAHANKLPELFA